jgi:hypothetical protein
MIGMKIKNPEDFKRILQGQKTVCVKKNSDRFTYYVGSDHSGMSILNTMTTEEPLNLNEDCPPDEDGLCVGLIVEIEEIYHEVTRL